MNIAEECIGQISDGRCGTALATMADAHLINAIRRIRGLGVRPYHVGEEEAKRLPRLLAEAERRGLDPAVEPYRRAKKGIR